ncbi:MAG: methyltransferase domain-containing protein [Verrucomicrobiota bacterium]
MPGDSLTWNQRYRDHDTPWDQDGAAPPLLEALDTHRIRGRVLVPGCGAGHDAVAIARAAQGYAQIVAVDIAPLAIEKARRLYPNFEIDFAVADFLDPPEGFEHDFYWVVEHTLLCALDPDKRPDYLAAVRRSLKPNGLYLGIFFRNPKGSEVPGYEGPPWPITVPEIDALFDPHFKLLEQFTPERSFPDREDRELVRLYRKTS